jgi:hypothetical protein
VLLAHQAVHEHHEPRRRLREGRGQRTPPRRDGEAADPDGHRLLERAALALQAVADQPVEEREAHAARERRRQRALRARAALDQRLRAAARGARRPAERADDALGDRVVHELDRRAERHVAERAAGDAALHRPDALREATELLEAEAHQRAGLVLCLADQLCHGSMYRRIG